MDYIKIILKYGLRRNLVFKTFKIAVYAVRYAIFKVHRGGSWYNSEKIIRVTNRRASNPKSKKVTVGFRVVKDVATFCPVRN